MSWPRALLWVSVAAWCFIALNFLLSLLIRLFSRAGRRAGGLRLRLTWGLAALGTAGLLLTRLWQAPAAFRACLDAALALGGVVCAGAMLVTLLQKGPSVLR